MSITCSDGRFWEHLDQDVGQCRRHVPTPVHWAMTQDVDSARGDALRVWPETGADDCCDEFRANQQSLAADFDAVRQTTDTPF